MGARRVLSLPRTRFFSRIVIVREAKSRSATAARMISDRLAPV